jgi:glycosyltransferase involved in cell wall biosynthesis
MHDKYTATAAAGGPLATIGIPVYNGEAYLEEAIRSALAQTASDLEVVISDNASTDRTAEICNDYAQQDSRVRYFRNPRNLGAAPNYNIVCANARGRYFKWLAHDDRILPSYVAKTTRVLEERTDAVLCNSVVAYIDGKGQPIGLYNTRLSQADAPSPSARFSWMVLRSHSCVDFFGMFRRSALAGSLQHGSFHGADRALLAQMALRGRLIQLPAPLVQMREHENRYTRIRRGKDTRAVWHDARLRGLRGRVNFPTWRLYLEYLKMVAGAQLPQDERMRCYATLSGWWVHNWNAARALVDVLAVVAPGMPGMAERLKARLFGAAPGHLAGVPRR